jgi:hypothetical protein
MATPKVTAAQARTHVAIAMRADFMARTVQKPAAGENGT